ncbi:MAG: hypothetical protein SCH39_01030 [Methanosarcinales archaeon]|nr:hypothetical protein [ANME-2 cluster archaeon]MDW7774902.1 hypothetical protein [Methanosarcinales archaeon]
MKNRVFRSAALSVHHTGCPFRSAPSALVVRGWQALFYSSGGLWVWRLGGGNGKVDSVGGGGLVRWLLKYNFYVVGCYT